MINNIELLKRDLIHIENIKTWLVDIPQIHPDSDKYLKLWSKYTRYCIEGLWGYDNGGWRYMPGTLFFYGNFFTFLDVDEEQNIRRKGKPTIRDIDWMLHYAYLEAQGFSGWEEDDEYTSDRAAIDPDEFKRLKHSKKAAEQKRFLCMINDNGEPKKYLSARDNIKKLHSVRKGRPLYWNHAKNLQIFGCLGKDTNIRMYDGTVKAVQDVLVGDEIMGPDSNKRIVKKLLRGSQPLYKISSKYSESFIATDTHILRVNRKTYTKKQNKSFIRNEEMNLSVGELLNIQQYDSRYNKSMTYSAVNSNIEYNSQSIEWHPYLLGLWLGDGFKKYQTICGNYEDIEILDWLKKYFDSLNQSYKITDYIGSLGTKPLWRFNWHVDDNSKWFNSIIKNNKHIPDNYIINSRKIRLELLAGMIDSDGSYDKLCKRFTITNTDIKLLKQFQNVARSLGLRAIIHKPSCTGISMSLKYNLRITGNIAEIPTKLLRKISSINDNTSNKHINSINIEFLTIDDFYGLEVDNDNLFVLEDYTITHNSRGGGKSFTFAGITAHHLTFDGLKYFSEADFINPPTVEVCVGSGDSTKSSEFCSKIVDGLNELGINPNLGVWGTIYDDEYTPCPFYRDWVGSLNPPNKKNPFRYEYEAKIGDRWVDGLGTKSKLIHVNYSDKKQGGETAAAGGRYVLMIYEEVGLQANFKDAVRSNVGTVTGKSGQFGVQVAIGTSGNIELVQQSKHVFTHPNEDNFLEYDDVWEQTGKIGFFLPAYLTNVTYKDENGNTDIDAALQYYAVRRAEAAEKSDPDVLRHEKMNFPIIPSDMWTSGKGHYFPVSELLEQERRLIHHGKYKTIGKPVKLTWDTGQQYGVKTDFDDTAEPFFDFPYGKNMATLDGAVLIYEEPKYVKGEIPNDMYFFVLDPYVADDPEEGGSLGAFYGFLNPKYMPEGFNGMTMVCSYIGKHPDGKDGFYSNIEKVIAYYGNNPRSLWYEANRGDSVRGYFVRKRKTHLLALRPTREKGSSAFEKRVIDYGIMVGGIEQKIELISDTADILLQHVSYEGVTKRYYETLPDIFLIRQLISFEIKKHKNFDAVSAFILMPLVVKELQHKTIDEAEKKNKHNPLFFLSVNPNVFKPQDTAQRLQKFKERYEQEYTDEID